MLHTDRYHEQGWSGKYHQIYPEKCIGICRSYFYLEMYSFETIETIHTRFQKHNTEFHLLVDNHIFRHHIFHVNM